MSFRQPLIGLSDVKFDAELHKFEIDHGFFDNPCDNFTNNMPRTDSEAKKETDTELDSAPSKDPVEGLGAMGSNEVPKSGQFCLSLDMSSNVEDDLVTPDTCVSSPMNFPQSHNIFSTGKLLQCLTQTEEDIDSVPHSSFFNQYFPHDQLERVTPSEQEDGVPSKGKLFDLSSSSDSDSEPDPSEPRILDTDDEEFVELLEKYYDYIDHGESDCSDITEVSPMSSLAGSPLPPFNALFANDEQPSTSGDKEASAIPAELNIFVRNQRFPTSSGSAMAQSKPLPPLIIHTMEEVQQAQKDSIRYSDQYGNEKEAASFATSLLMKVHKEEQNFATSSGNSDQKDLSEASFFQKTSSSSSNSASSAITFSDSTSIRIGSSASSFGSFTNEKKHQKNYSFTPDQSKKIERDNSLLLRKILDTHKSHNGHWLHTKGSIHHHRFGHHHHQSAKASATILRQRQQRRIDHENLIMMRRLQTVKPSKEIVEAFRSGTSNVKCT